MGVRIVAGGVGLLWLSLLVFAWQSRREGERRAARVALGAAALGLLLLVPAALLPLPIQVALAGLLAAGALLGGLLLLLPSGRVAPGNDRPQSRVDERTIMFARARLVPGSPEYESYYALHPEDQAIDERIRAQPGLLAPTSLKAHPLHFPATEAGFRIPEALRGWVNGPVAESTRPLAPETATPYLKGLARHIGARTVGVAALEPYHVYSHIGRGSGAYGAPLEVKHRYALAFTVEMDHALVGTAPNAPTALETAHEYAVAARIAVQLAAFIRELGYPARAHIDGNYRVIAPLVARDAGLGEIGRMGLLMTPELGPRVRLGVVTTDLPLAVDGRAPRTDVLDFCRICKKCAENCPSRAIPFDDRREIDGALRWQIDSVKCFHYWNVAGTDCGRCLSVCPYSHPDTPSHNLVRWAIRRSGFARRAALRLDDLFYGRRPEPRPAPSWMDVEL
ncbi:MAG: 4Fe-4S dicluster domain-containing protein [Anaerolineales bacterium]